MSIHEIGHLSSRPRIYCNLWEATMTGHGAFIRAAFTGIYFTPDRVVHRLIWSNPPWVQEAPMTEPRRYKRLTPFERLCARLDCSALELWALAIAGGYVGILVAWCVRHAASGAW